MVAPGGGGRLIFGLGSLGRMMQSVGQSSIGMGIALGGIVGVLAVATIGVTSFVGAVKNLIDTGVKGAATVENLLISFEALTGSAEAAHFRSRLSSTWPSSRRSSWTPSSTWTGCCSPRG